MKLNVTNIFKKTVAPLALASVPFDAFAQSASQNFLGQNREAIAVLVVIYIFPALISYWRKHPSKGSIILIDILLGWTVIGWLVALIWACGSTKQVVVIANAVSATNAMPVAQATPVAVSVANKTIAERISDLKAMLDSGAISEAEFDVLKKDAMKGMG